MVVLKVKKSEIKGSGNARINTAIAKELGVKSRDSIEVRKNDKFLYLSAVIDDLIPKDEISIREADLVKLGVGAGEELAVTKVIPAKELVKKRIEKAKARVKKVKARVKKRLEKVKKRLKKLKRD
jgi:anaerobic selenocysteine-containing dehydrogenase